MVRITPADVGSRVSVRTRLHGGQGQPSTTDTVGVLVAWSGGLLRIQRRDGSEAVVAESDLLAGRTIPPPPDRGRYPA